MTPNYQAGYDRAVAAILKAFPTIGTFATDAEWKASRTCHCAMCTDTFYLPLLSHTDGRFWTFKHEHTPKVPLCSPQCEQSFIDTYGLRSPTK